MPDNIRKAGLFIGLAFVLCALFCAQVIAAMAAGLLGAAPLMVMALQTIGGTALLLTFESGAPASTDTAVARRMTILRICVVAAMATTFVAGHRLTSGQGAALTLALCMTIWFSNSVPAKRFGLRRVAVVLLTGFGVLLLSGVLYRVLRAEDAGSALLGLCFPIYLYVAERKARAGHNGALPALCWMALTVVASLAFTASDPTWTIWLLAGFALVTGLLWVFLVLILARLRNTRPARFAVSRYAPVYAPVLATVVGLFGIAPWVTPLDTAGIVLVCLGAFAVGRARTSNEAPTGATNN